MSTQREIIYAIKSVLRGGLISDDDKISDRQVAFHIDAVRALLLRQQYNKGQSLSENNLQHIKCIPLESVDTSFNSDFNLDCKVFRTQRPVPKPVEARGKDLITSITAPEFGGFSYEFIPYSRLPYARNTRFKRPLAVLFNSFIYIIDSPYTEQISISGIFEQPNALADYDDCAGDQCFNWDSVYPVSSHLVDPIIKMVIEELTLSLKVMQDRTNNGNQGLDPQIKTEESGS